MLDNVLKELDNAISRKDGELFLKNYELDNLKKELKEANETIENLVKENRELKKRVDVYLNDYKTTSTFEELLDDC